MKVLVTGAHFTPAQAVIEELLKDRNNKIVYVGRKYTREGDKSPSIESQILPSLGVKFISLTAGRVRRVAEFQTILSLLKIPVGFIQAFFIVLTENPDVVLSFGGYTSVPVVFAGWLLSKPILLHEQTLVSGLANSFCSFFADKIAVSFDREYTFPKVKIVVTGNPFRKEIMEVSISSKGIKDLFLLAKKENLKTILVTGGNQGSHLINEKIKNLLLKLNENYVVIHQTGDSKFNDYEILVQSRNQLKYPERYFVTKWIDAIDMSYIYRKIDLIISRAGANTLLEIAYFGVPAIVIPIPFIYKDEQTVNAKFFESKGLCIYMNQNSLNENKLFEEISNTFKDYEQIRNRSKNAKGVVVLNAAQKIVQELLILSDKDV